MRLVYWGCWADSSGKQGPYSATLVTRIDGDHLQLVQTPQQRREQTIIITSGQRALPELIDTDAVEVGELDERRLLTDESAPRRREGDQAAVRVPTLACGAGGGVPRSV